MKEIVNHQVLASAQRTTDPTSVTLSGDVLKNADYIDIVVDVTSINAVTPTITLTISATDEESSSTYPLLVSAGITTVSTTALRIGANLTAAANVTANYPVPDKLTIAVAHTDTDAIDYSVGAKIYKSV